MVRRWAFFVILIAAPAAHGDETRAPGGAREMLSPQQWKRLDRAVDRGLEFLITQQRDDGSFNAPDLGQPGITSLCVLAFLSRGHVPQEGPYGKRIERAIRFVLEQQQENGLLFGLPVNRTYYEGSAAQAGIYNHAISGVMLSEVYGMTDAAHQVPLAAAIKAAVEFTQQHQRRNKRNRVDEGGWRYLGDISGLRNDADLSVTSWQLMFLRSARNAEFEVAKESIDEAMAYVRRTFDQGEGAFRYTCRPPSSYPTRAMVGSGILSLSLGGEHQSPLAKQAGDWVLRHPFDEYNRAQFQGERYHYSAYYCSQAMFQLGGEHWEQFFPPLMRVLVENQQFDGSWQRESSRDGHFGNAYTTALAVLSLTPPYQLLPIYQR